MYFAKYTNHYAALYPKHFKIYKDEIKGKNEQNDCFMFI